MVTVVLRLSPAPSPPSQTTVLRRPHRRHVLLLGCSSAYREPPPQHVPCLQGISPSTCAMLLLPGCVAGAWTGRVRAWLIFSAEHRTAAGCLLHHGTAGLLPITTLSACPATLAVGRASAAGLVLATATNPCPVRPACSLHFIQVSSLRVPSLVSLALILVLYRP